MNILQHLICLGFTTLLITSSVLADQICQRDGIPQHLSNSRFSYDEKNVVIDNRTGLMWTTCIDGLNGERCESGTPTLFTWGEALLRTAEINENEGLANHKDWRLPNIRELTTLIDIQCLKPSIDMESFPNTPASHTWSSSPYHTLTFYSWYIDFATGETNTDDRLNKKVIRLVRSVR
ncbi:DUF1566 domain-containing protein [Cellvibrio sp. UBA7671]|uniref:Lcl C-terminal domain-containing protein n=1 Tax=Cellvibrio sp. UBA7671 TaxID=1946312 RepID=UPI0039C874FF